MPLIASKAPDSAKKKKAGQSVADKPKPIIAHPQKPAAIAIALPSCLMLAVHPLKNEINKEPTAGAAYNKPNILTPPNDCAIAGNNALGIAKTIAIKSTQ